MPHTTPVFFQGRVQGAASQGLPGHFAAHNDLSGPGRRKEENEGRKRRSAKENGGRDAEGGRRATGGDGKEEAKEDEGKEEGGRGEWDARDEGRGGERQAGG